MPTAALRDHDRWVLLTLHLRRGVLVIDYEDETGRMLQQVAHALPQRPQTNAYAPDPPVFVSPPTPIPAGVRAISQLLADLHGATRLEELLQEAVADLHEQRVHHPSPAATAGMQVVPWLLPLFVKPPRGLETLPWEDWLESALPTQVAGRLVALRWMRTPPVPGPLPLPWVLLDRRGPDTPSLRALRQMPWYKPMVARHGLHLYGESPKPPLPPHVTIEQGTPAGPANPAWQRDCRLRVRLLDADEQPWEDAPGTAAARQAVSTLAFMPPPGGASYGDPVVELVYALVHDFALHEAVWLLRRCLPGWQVALASSPVAIQSLRLSRTMLALRDELASGPPALPAAITRPSELRRRVHALDMRFDHEREGLTEMSELRAAMASGGRRAGVAGSAGAVASELPRQVDLTLQRYDAHGIAHEITRDERRLPLRCGWRYRLAVQIGVSDAEYTLFDTPPPPLDALLPPLAPGEAHEIEVCLYAKDFQLLGANVHTLHLAQRGPSNQVVFELRAPELAGRAELRVVLYHRNNLLQSFVVSAELAVGECTAAGNSVLVSARLTASGVADFAAWKPPPRRALSVALNDDADPSRHTLMVKVDGAAIESRIDEAALRRIVDDFGRQADLIGQDADRERSLRQLARIGARLYELLLRSGALAAELEVLRSQREPATLQFARHGSRTSLPWQLVYDLRLPDVDFATAPVCWGRAPVRGQPAAGQLGCRHRPGEAVICVEGFWAFRHRIERLSENLLRDGAAQGHDRAVQVRAPPPHPLVALGSSLDDDWAAKLEAGLRRHFEPRLHVFAPADAPIAESLWRAERRPALLVLFSHFHDSDDENNLDERVYACLPATAAHAISPAQLARVLAGPNPPWGAPTRPVVLLMACQSARRRMLALNPMTDTLLDVGAAAVVGTECDVRTRDAQAFALHLARATLRHGLSLGDAMRAWHRRTLRSRDVLSFVFTAYGHADLHLA